MVREFVYTLAAVCPYDGALSSLIMPWVDAEIMSIFLSHTAQEFSADFCLLFLDGAGWHRARELRIPASMKLLFLPSYSPELNPVEHLWDHIRDNYFKNLALGSLDDVENLLVEALCNLSSQSAVVKSMTDFYWLNTVCMTSN